MFIELLLPKLMYKNSRSFVELFLYHISTCMSIEPFIEEWILKSIGKQRVNEWFKIAQQVNVKESYCFELQIWITCP